MRLNHERAVGTYLRLFLLSLPLLLMLTVAGGEPTGVHADVVSSRALAALADMSVRPLGEVALRTPLGGAHTSAVPAEALTLACASWLRKGSLPRSAGSVATDGAASDSIVGGWRGTNMSAPESFGVHYAKHGVGMAEGEYDAAAQSWASAPAGVSKPIQLADGSWGTKWQTPGGGPGGIVDDGNISTYWTK
jgi:hypothetical protein